MHNYLSGIGASLNSRNSWEKGLSLMVIHEKKYILYVNHPCILQPLLLHTCNGGTMTFVLSSFVVVFFSCISEFSAFQRTIIQNHYYIKGTYFDLQFKDFFLSFFTPTQSVTIWCQSSFNNFCTQNINFTPTEIYGYIPVLVDLLLGLDMICSFS